MKKTQKALLLATAMSLGQVAVSNAVQIDYTATGAGGHVVWFQDNSLGDGTKHNEFNPVGTYTEDYAADVATLMGTAVDGGGNGFIINATFTGYVSSSDPAPAGSPKIEGDGTNIDDWWYWTSTTGTLTGVGNQTGNDYTFDRMGPAFQVGLGANGKNSLLGASGWLNIYSTDTSDNNVYRGDFNINLSRVPDGGSTLALMGAAVGLVGFARNRKKKLA